MLALHEIKHRKTKVRSPRTNGFVERMNRTLLDECFRIKGREKWYETPEEIQRDLDEYLAYLQPRAQPPGLSLEGPHTGPGAARSSRKKETAARRSNRRKTDPETSRMITRRRPHVSGNYSKLVHTLTQFSGQALQAGAF